MLKEIDELKVAAKSCKVSAEDARRIKAEIAGNKRDSAATLEQRKQVAELVEKREMQKANVSAEVSSRPANVCSVIVSHLTAFLRTLNWSAN